VALEEWMMANSCTDVCQAWSRLVGRVTFHRYGPLLRAGPATVGARSIEVGNRAGVLGGLQHLAVLDGYAGRGMLGRCRSRLGHFPKTCAEGAGSSESNPAPPRPDPLRVWGRIAPYFGDYGDYKP
jgi:hypothetical protein